MVFDKKVFCKFLVIGPHIAVAIDQYVAVNKRLLAAKFYQLITPSLARDSARGRGQTKIFFMTEFLPIGKKHRVPADLNFLFRFLLRGFCHYGVIIDGMSKFRICI